MLDVVRRLFPFVNYVCMCLKKKLAMKGSEI